MYELGKKEEFSNLDKALTPLTIYGRPGAFPQISQGEVVICEYNQFVWKKLYWCQTLEDMQQIWDAADSGDGFVTWHKSTMLFVELATVRIQPFPESK